MKKKGTSGGNTITGLNFERSKDILSILSKVKNYSVKGNIIYYNSKDTIVKKQPEVIVNMAFINI